MQSSPIPGQHLKPGTIKSPATPVAPNPESSTSPRRVTAQLSSRSPNAHPSLTGTLRMGSFYNIDPIFTRLREALKPGSKAARSSALPAVLDELQGAIKISTLDAEKAFTRRSYATCRLHLAAAKSNQVAMLVKLDAIADAHMSDNRRTGIRSACVEVGAALTTMLIQATTMENASAQEKILKQKARENDSDSDSDSDARAPSSPPPAEPTPESHRISPARSTQKRTQGDADSPVLAQSPGKRQKIDTATSGTTTTNATSTTTTTNATAGIPQSPPAYRPAPQFQIEHVASGATSVDSTSKQDKPATASSTTKGSPQKMRALSPQARPRPRSQLFVAPPDFTSQVREDPADCVRTAAPVQVLPGAKPSDAAECAQSGADGSGQRS